jgi:nickel-type superoxide dismutase maturation protease
MRVEGPSMLPTLSPGRTVLMNPRAYRRTIATVGDIVVCEHPQQPGLLMIKRITEIDKTGVVVLGDNPDASTDSRHFGRVPLRNLCGRVECFFV